MSNDPKPQRPGLLFLQLAHERRGDFLEDDRDLAVGILHDDRLAGVAAGADILHERNFAEDHGAEGPLDLAVLAQNWQQQCSMPYWCLGADMDFSKRVDFRDLILLADQWLLPR